MKLSQLFLALGAALAFSGAANAAILVGGTGSPDNAVADYSTAGLVAFDLDVRDFSSTRLDFMIEDGDLLGPLAMNALLRNLSGAGIANLTFSLAGIAFSAPGSVTPTFGTISKVSYSSDAAGIAFKTPEFAELHFGNPFGLNGKSDWYLDTTSLRAGDAFSITTTVPEPASVMLMLAALLMLGVYRVKQRDEGMVSRRRAPSSASRPRPNSATPAGSGTSVMSPPVASIR